MKWALDKNEKLVHISGAMRGHACEASCFSCGEVVSARKGEKNEHHFAHVSGASDCSINLETVLHLLGKEAIRTSMRLICPAMADTSKSIELVFFDIGEEVRLEGMQPDLVGTTRFGRIAIEIAVTSFCDERKREVISALAMPTIEIDLSRFHGNDFDPSVVREFVLNSHEGKYWIVAANEPQKPSVEDEIKERIAKILPVEEHIRVYGSSIWVKKWPDGGIDVRSPYFNPAFAAALRVIRKEFGGRWIPHQKVNRFPAYSAPAVLVEIRRLPALWS